MTIRFCILLMFMFMLSCEKQPNDQTIDQERIHQSLAIQSLKPTAIETDSKVKLSKKDFKKPKATTVREFQQDIGTLIPLNRNGISSDEIPRQALFSTPKIPVPFGRSKDNALRYLLITFENDIFAETDYYYTNGFSVGLVHPVLNRGFLGVLLPSLGLNATTNAGLRIHHFMFTPQNPEATVIDASDRPFAGVLLGEYFKLSQLSRSGLSLHSSIRLGVIGKASLAQELQTAMHQLEPKGWDYQIANDMLLNFDLSLEKTLFRHKYIEISGLAEAGIGSYQTYAGFSFQLRIGLFNSMANSFLPNLEITGQATPNRGRLWFFVQPSWHYVAHNASLNGGLFNKKSPHFFTHNEITHHVPRVSAGLNWNYHKIGFGLRWIYIGPEFQSAKQHNWGSLNLFYSF